MVSSSSNLPNRVRRHIRTFACSLQWTRLPKERWSQLFSSPSTSSQATPPATTHRSPSLIPSPLSPPLPPRHLTSPPVTQPPAAPENIGPKSVCSGTFRGRKFFSSKTDFVEKTFVDCWFLNTYVVVQIVSLPVIRNQGFPPGIQ